MTYVSYIGIYKTDIQSGSHVIQVASSIFVRFSQEKYVLIGLNILMVKNTSNKKATAFTRKLKKYMFIKENKSAINGSRFAG